MSPGWAIDLSSAPPLFAAGGGAVREQQSQRRILQAQRLEQHGCGAGFAQRHGMHPDQFGGGFSELAEDALQVRFIVERIQVRSAKPIYPRRHILWPAHKPEPSCRNPPRPSTPRSCGCRRTGGGVLIVLHGQFGLLPCVEHGARHCGQGALPPSTLSGRALRIRYLLLTALHC